MLHIILFGESIGFFFIFIKLVEAKLAH